MDKEVNGLDKTNQAIKLKEKDEDNSDSEENREHWTNWFDFFLSCVGYAVGIGNIARFPYLCYKNGGGAFLIPYLLFVVFLAYPLLYMELAMGQYMRMGANGIWEYYCPILSGLGYAMMIISGWVSIYYNGVIGWSLYYFYSSFAPVLPWSVCNNTFNTIYCFVDRPSSNVTVLPATVEFLNFGMLQLDLSFQISFSLLPHLVLCLFIAWTITYLAMFLGVRSSGKVVYFTATFPYVVLIAFLIRGVTLPGSGKGIEYYVIPNFTKLAEGDPWVDAVSQIFYSYGIGFGSLITFGSYNKFKNRMDRDVIYVILANSGTSIFAGFVVFSMLGYLAFITNSTVQSVVQEGLALALVVYPQAIAKLPAPHVWAVLFFIMLMTLGMDSMFGMIEAVSTGISDRVKNRVTKRKPLLVLLICLAFFLIGLILATKASIFVVTIMDKYCGGRSLILVVLFETIAVSWVYGVDKFADNIYTMTGSKVFILWKICWKIICPGCLLAIFILSIVKDQRMTYLGQRFPDWAVGVGVGMTVSSIIFVPYVAVFRLASAKGSFSHRLKTLVFSRKTPKVELNKSNSIDNVTNF